MNFEKATSAVSADVDRPGAASVQDTASQQSAPAKFASETRIEKLFSLIKSGYSLTVRQAAAVQAADAFAAAANRGQNISHQLLLRVPALLFSSDSQLRTLAAALISRISAKLNFASLESNAKSEEHSGIPKEVAIWAACAEQLSSLQKFDPVHVIASHCTLLASHNVSTGGSKLHDAKSSVQDSPNHSGGPDTKRTRKRNAADLKDSSPIAEGNSAFSSLSSPASEGKISARQKNVMLRKLRKTSHNSFNEHVANSDTSLLPPKFIGFSASPVTPEQKPQEISNDKNLPSPTPSNTIVVKFRKESENGTLLSEGSYTEISAYIWPLQPLANYILDRTNDASWVVRHGCFLALSAMLAEKTCYFGMLSSSSSSERKKQQVEFLLYVTYKILVVLCIDRFADFGGDSVCAPVCAAAAIALRDVSQCLLKVNSNSFLAICTALRKIFLTANSSSISDQGWIVMHSALLGMRELLAQDFDVHAQAAPDILFDVVLTGLSYSDDDVRAVAASVAYRLLYYCTDKTKPIFKTRLRSVAKILVSCLSEYDDLSTSLSAVMDLLVGLSESEEWASLNDQTLFTTTDIVLLLCRFFRHPLSCVRVSLFRTLRALAPTCAVANAADEIIYLERKFLQLVFQTWLLEDYDSVLSEVTLFWNHLVNFIKQSSLAGQIDQKTGMPSGHTKFIETALGLITTSCMKPLPKTLLLVPSDDCSEEFKFPLFFAEPYTSFGIDEPMVNRDTCVVSLARIKSSQLSAATALGRFIAAHLTSKNSTDMVNTISRILLPLLQTTKSVHTILIAATVYYELAQLDKDIDSKKVLFEVTNKLIEIVATIYDGKPHLDIIDKQAETHSLLKSNQSNDFPRVVVFPVHAYLNKVQVFEIEQLFVAMQYAETEYLLQSTIAQQVAQTLTRLVCSEKTDKMLHEGNTGSAELGVSYREEVRKQIFQHLAKLANFANTPRLEVPCPTNNVLTTFLETQEIYKNTNKEKHPTPSRSTGKQRMSEFMEMGDNAINDAARALVCAKKWTELICEPLASVLLHEDSTVFNNFCNVIDLKQACVSEPKKSTAEFKARLWFIYEFSKVCTDEKVILKLVAQVPVICDALGSEDPFVRHSAAHVVAQLCYSFPSYAFETVLQYISPALRNDSTEFSRLGAAEAMHIALDYMGKEHHSGFTNDSSEYAVLFVMPLLRAMSDRSPHVRACVSLAFARVVQLLAIDEGRQQDQRLVRSRAPSELLLEQMKEDRKFLDQLLNPRQVTPYQVPVSLRAELRGYQREGVTWIMFLNRFGLAGALCDDMGLGKTLQTIAVLSSHHHETQQNSNFKPPLSLIVCPNILCNHWVSEIRRFSSNLVPKTILGSNDPVLIKLSKGQAFVDANVFVASYETLRTGKILFEKINFSYAVVDEAHVLGNPKSKLTLAAKMLRATHRLVLTGTPIQNSLLDLWSIFDFLIPGFLGTRSQFERRFARPILGVRDLFTAAGATGSTTSEKKADARSVLSVTSIAAVQQGASAALASLHRQVLPFIMRRLKENVLDDLPPKIIQDLVCEMGPKQRSLYSTIEATASGEPEGNNMALKALSLLRKICTHPGLYNKEYMTWSLKDAPKFNMLKRLLTEAGACSVTSDHTDESDDEEEENKRQRNEDDKTSAFAALQTNADERPHRFLVFCQLSATITVLEETVFKPYGVSYLRLDKTTPANQRQSVVDRFNTDEDVSVLALTTAAGGVGLNLVGADCVVFMEHDWNPMKDLQAMDRAHRIGQKRTVNVYRLITRQSIEDRILGLQRFKLHMAGEVVTQQNACMESMGSNDILGLVANDDNINNSNSKHGGRKT